MSPRLERLAAMRVTLRTLLELYTEDLADLHTPGKAMSPRAQVAFMRLGSAQLQLRDVEQELEREQQRVGR